MNGIFDIFKEIVTQKANANIGDLLTLLTIYGIYIAFLQVIVTPEEKWGYYMGFYLRKWDLVSRLIIKWAESPIPAILFACMFLLSASKNNTCYTFLYWLKIIVSLFFVYLLYACIKIIEDRYLNNREFATNSLCCEVERKCEKKICRKLRLGRVKKNFTKKNEISVLVEELNRLVNRKREVKYDESMAEFLTYMLERYGWIEKIDRNHYSGIYNTMQRLNDLLLNCMPDQRTWDALSLISCVETIRLKLFDEYILKEERIDNPSVQKKIDEYNRVNAAIWKKCHNYEEMQAVIYNVKSCYDILVKKEEQEKPEDIWTHNRKCMLRSYIRGILEKCGAVDKANAEYPSKWQLMNLLDILEIKSEDPSYLYRCIWEYIHTRKSVKEAYLETITYYFNNDEKLFLLFYIFYQGERSSQKTYDFISVELYRKYFIENTRRNSEFWTEDNIVEMLKETGISYYVSANEVLELYDDLKNPITIETLMKYSGSYSNISTGLFIVLKCIFGVDDLSMLKVDEEIDEQAYENMEEKTEKFFEENENLLNNYYVKRVWEKIKYLMSNRNIF